MYINADDFGKNARVNAAIAEAFARGVINRTTVMVNMPAADEAREIAAAGGFLPCVGLHINLTEGPALSDAARQSPLCDESGCFTGRFHVSPLARFVLRPALMRAIAAETEAQIKRFLAMGFTLRHADSHNYTHTYPVVALPIARLLRAYRFSSIRISRNIPRDSYSSAFGLYKRSYNSAIRRFKVGGRPIATTRFFGSTDDYDAFRAATPDLDPAAADDVELMTHPDLVDGALLDDTLPNPHPFVTPDWIAAHGGHLTDLRKTRLLVTFIPTHIGGAMTSLVNFLNALDLERYEVDVIFLEEKEPGRHGIKAGINILPQAKVHESMGFGNIVRKLLSPRYVGAKLREQYHLRVTHNRKRAVQIMSRQGCRYSRRLETHYDVAIAYEFSWPMYYTAHYVNADRRLLWHHLDYAAAGFDFAADRTTFDRFDRMIFVSRETMRIFTEAHPAYTDRSLFLPNLLSADFVRARGATTVPAVFAPTDRWRMISVARINFAHKGYDRGLSILRRLRAEGAADGLRWVIIGDGKDADRLQALIAEYDLADCVSWLGKLENPIPYLAQADLLFLPSRFEGKPMVVTEAQIMGVVPLVSRYASADEQIAHGVDGIVTDNDEDALYRGLRALLDDRTALDRMHTYIAAHDYGNTHEIAGFDRLIDQLGKEETA